MCKAERLLIEDVRELIKLVEGKGGGVKGLGITCYLKGVRDTLDGADLNHIVKNIQSMASS